MLSVTDDVEMQISVPRKCSGEVGGRALTAEGTGRFVYRGRAHRLEPEVHAVLQAVALSSASVRYVAKV